MKKYGIFNGIIAFILTSALFTAAFPSAMAMFERDEDVERLDLVWETVPLTKGAMTRESLDLQGNGAFYVDGGSGSAIREAFMQIDLTPYFDGSMGIIDIEEFRFKINITEGTSGKNVGIYILPPELSEFDPSTLKGAMVLNGVFQGANSVQYVHPDTGTSMRDDITCLVGTLAPENKAPFYTDDIWPGVKKWLDGHPGVTKITFRLSKEYAPVSGNSKKGDVRAGDRVTYTFSGFIADNTPFNRPFFRIGFKNEPILKVEEAMKNFTFAQCSAEDSGNLTRNLTLPALLDNGVSVSWRSSKRGAVSDAGDVTRPPYGERDADAVLTAAFSYGNYSVARDYNVTVLSGRANPYYSGGTVTAEGAAYVNKELPDSVMGGNQLICNSVAGEDTIFLKFDFSGQKDNLDDLDNILLRLIPFNAPVNGGNKEIAVYMAGSANWDGGSLTYNGASGILAGLSAPVKEYSGEFDENGIFYVWDVLSAVRDYFGNNPTADGSVTFIIKSAGGRFSFHSTGALADDLKPSAIAVSYADALRETKDYITAGKIYGGTIDWVRSDLNLFTSWLYSAGISWSSPDNEKGVVNPSTGEVTRLPNEDVPVTLTATITSGSLTGTVTIPAVVLGLSSDQAFFKTLLDEIEFDTMALTDGFTVPVEREMLDIAWVSENGGILSVADGNTTVERPKDGDYPLKATASISDLGVTVSRDFHFTVIRHAGNDLFVKKTVLDDFVILDGDGIDVGPKKRLAVDSNANTFWRVDNGDRRLTLDLGAPKMLGEFILVYDGRPVSGFKVEMSRETEFTKPDVYLSGQLQPKAANYLFPEQMSYSRYIRLTCPEGVTGVRFLGGYSSQNESSLEESLWRNISLPEETAFDFPLPGETAAGVQITWTSSNTAFIKVDGNTAKVTRDAYKQTVRMKAEITVDEKNYDKTFYVAVTGTGGSGTGGSGTGVGGNAYRPGGGSGTGGGPGSSTSVSNDIIKPSAPVAVSDEPFSDLSEAAWAKDYIIKLHGQGIINGKGEGKFDPNGCLKREEMAKLLAAAFTLDASDVILPFSDVKDGEWYYDFVRDLYGNGITRGISGDTFGVGLNISRQDAALLIARITGAEKTVPETVSKEGFSDDGQIADYAKNGVYALKALGILSGDENGGFNPYADITRAEMSKIIYSSFQLIN